MHVARAASLTVCPTLPGISELLLQQFMFNRYLSAALLLCRSPHSNSNVREGGVSSCRCYSSVTSATMDADFDCPASQCSCDQLQAATRAVLQQTCCQTSCFQLGSSVHVLTGAMSYNKGYQAFCRSARLSPSTPAVMYWLSLATRR